MNFYPLFYFFKIAANVHAQCHIGLDISMVYKSYLYPCWYVLDLKFYTLQNKRAAH